jgi:hypothetical protein
MVQRPEVAPPATQWLSAIEREVHPVGHWGGRAPRTSPDQVVVSSLAVENVRGPPSFPILVETRTPGESTEVKKHNIRQRVASSWPRRE